MKIGIDQSFKKTGVVVLDDDENLVHYEVIGVEVEKTEVAKVYACRHIADRIVRLCDQYNVSRVVLEGLGFGASGNQTRDLAGLQFVIISELIFSGYEEKMAIVPPNTLKKFATGNGKADKKLMLESLPEYVYDIFSKKTIEKGKYDLADAYWLACYEG